jgi:chloride channel protein, CIC family
MRTIREVMEPAVFCLPEGAPLTRVAEELAARNISGAPVCGPDGEVVGIVSKSDLAEAFGAAGDGLVAADVMTPSPLAVAPTDPLERAIGLMAFEGVHRLLVRDRSGALLGIVTSMDVVRELAGYGRTASRIMAVAPPATTDDAKTGAARR